MQIKKCYRCGKEKPIEGFSKNKSKKDGRSSECKTCRREYRWENKKYFSESPKRWVQINRERSRYLHRRSCLKLYGITPEQYDEMFKKQGGVCAICGQEETHKKKGKIISLAVDHHHKTGKIRGLLCCSCNTGLGKFHHNSELIEKAATYVRRHPENS